MTFLYSAFFCFSFYQCCLFTVWMLSVNWAGCCHCWMHVKSLHIISYNIIMMDSWYHIISYNIIMMDSWYHTSVFMVRRSHTDSLPTLGAFSSPVGFVVNSRPIALQVNWRPWGLLAIDTILLDIITETAQLLLWLLWDLMRMHAIPEHLRGEFVRRCYRNPRLPLPLLLKKYW